MSQNIKLMTSKRLNETGFTLVELIIALFISGLVMAAVITIYIAQTKSYTSRDDIAGIQQNLRGALAIMPMEIRLAGCNPKELPIPNQPSSAPIFGILAATGTNFRFSMDTKNVGPPRNNTPDGFVTGDEDIAYGFAAGVITDVDGRVLTGGQPWSGTASLGRQIADAGGYQPLADNIEALEFNYIILPPGGTITTTTRTPSAAEFKQIRAVQVSLLARASLGDSSFRHNASYTTASGVVWTPNQDNFRRRLVITTIQCRNMR